MKKPLKVLKKIGIITIGLIVSCVFLPWVATTALGSIIGTLVASFMTGFKRGTVFMQKVSIAFAYLRTVAENKKISRKALEIIELYPGGLEKLLADYRSKADTLKTDFIFKNFGTDHTVEVENYLKTLL